jgi:hypothetical protein
MVLTRQFYLQRFLRRKILTCCFEVPHVFDRVMLGHL